MWKREEKKIPYKCGGCSLIGALGNPPIPHGNYFYLNHKGELIRVGNMWLENLEHALEHFLEDKLVNIVIYRENDNSWCLVHDERIPEDYYIKKLCWTGSSPPSIDILKDMYKTRGDLENDIERYTNLQEYFNKKRFVHIKEKFPSVIRGPVSKDFKAEKIRIDKEKDWITKT